MTVALLFHGDREGRDTINLDDHRLSKVAAGMRGVGLEPVPAVYNDDFADEVRDQLLGVDGVLVWVNPIEGTRDRTKLDAMLKEVADSGVFVSAHPDTIQRMGTKQVLFDTREMEWGSDVRVYLSLTELEEGLKTSLSDGKPRVLKQYRGHSGHGIWKVTPIPSSSDRVKVRHAARGSVEQEMPLAEFVQSCVPYFAGEGRMFDQAYQERLTDGMVRCYLVRDRVAGFGHQEINALFPATDASNDAPQPGPRLYFSASQPEFQALRAKMEEGWVADLRQVLGLELEDLPLLWDADFFFGPLDERGKDTHVLCEINVSSVYPFPEDAIPAFAAAAKEVLTLRASRGSSPLRD